MAFSRDLGNFPGRPNPHKTTLTVTRTGRKKPDWMKICYFTRDPEVYLRLFTQLRKTSENRINGIPAHSLMNRGKT